MCPEIGSNEPWANNFTQVSLNLKCILFLKRNSEGINRTNAKFLEVLEFKKTWGFGAKLWSKKVVVRLSSLEFCRGEQGLVFSD